MSLWHDGDSQDEKRRNRESLPLRLLHPAYDIAEGGTVTADALAVTGAVTTVETTHYTAGAGVYAVIVASLNLCNNDAAAQQCNLYLVPSGGSIGGNVIFADTLQPGESVDITGPFILGPSQTIRSVAASATGTMIALRCELLVLSTAVPGVALIVDDGDALTTSLAAYYTCPASGVEHANVVSIVACNSSGVVTPIVTIEIRPSGGGQSDAQNVFAGALSLRETLLIGDASRPFVLAPGDAIYAKASAAATVGFRVTPIEYATS